MTTPSEATVDATRGAELTVGTQVGEYLIDGKLGEGGFGTVYRATHPLIGKVVAIKVLSRALSVDPDMVSRFVAEARAVNQIRHRNIVDIFGFGQLPDERQYYVMAFLEGESLTDRLAREGALPLAAALPLLEPLARALDAAHAQGIAHRDLKPDNVMLARDPDGAIHPTLLDFGIAKLLGTSGGAMHKTRTGAPIGTPHYMSPEQCRGRDVDHRTDIYAFGVVMYQVLTGQVPFDGEDFMDILLKQLNDEAPRPSSLQPGLPVEVDVMLAAMMAKDAAARPTALTPAIDELIGIATTRGLMEAGAAGGAGRRCRGRAAMPRRQWSQAASRRQAPTSTPPPRSPPPPSASPCRSSSGASAARCGGAW